MAFERKFGESLPDWVPPPRPDAQVLTGQYARLERLDPAAHAEALYQAMRVDDAIWDYMWIGPFADLASHGHWIKEAACGHDPYFFAIRDIPSDQLGGVASFLRIAPDVGSIEVGSITLAPVLQRSRAATEAMFLMMQWAFDAGYRRYEWKCDALNLPSRRAAQRLGFSYEGIFRQATIYKGRNRDTAWFAVTDGDWPALRAAYQRWLDPLNFDASGRQTLRLSDLTQPLLVMRDPAF
jgi:RimJ/RimL family protein N-acetyltransferase